MLTCWILLVATLILGVKLLFDKWVNPPRWIIWALPLLSYAILNCVIIEADGFLRMVALCSLLLAGMKWVVYAEWRKSGGAKLNWGQWLCFATLWFGMDPTPWLRERVRVEYTRDLTCGVLCMTVGVVGVAGLAWLEIGNLQLLFVAMSIGFHFGVLRLLVAFWKRAGVPVKPLFRNLLKMKGFRDFWGKRWNLAFSQMMARVVLRPLTPLFGNKEAQFMVFVISGLLHELAITVPVQAGYGLPTLFFILHGLITVLERRGNWVVGILCGVSLIVGMPLLFPEEFVVQVILPARDVLRF